MPQETKDCLNATSQIVIAAMQSGKLPVEDASAVADYFSTIYWQVFESSQLTPADLRTRQSRQNN